MIPEAKRYVVKANSESNIVRLTYGKQLKETLKYIEMLTKFFKQYHGVTFSEIMGDFIKDESNTWWLVNIKGFEIESINKTPNILKSLSLNMMERVGKSTEDASMEHDQEKYQKTKICKYCEKPFL